MKRGDEVDPLIRAIKLRREARKAGAHPSVIARLESVVAVYARTAIEQFKETEGQFPILSTILDAQTENKTFSEKLDFKIKLLPYKTDASWVEGVVLDMKKTLDGKEMPQSSPTCEQCQNNNAIQNLLKKVELEKESDPAAELEVSHE